MKSRTRRQVQDGPCHTYDSLRFQCVPRDVLTFGAALLTCVLYFASLTPRKGGLLIPIPNSRTSAVRNSVAFEKLGAEALDAIVNVRLTTEEKERLRDDADMAALSMSALIRARYFGRPVVAHADQVMIKELRRLGGLMKHLHNESNGAYAAETSAALQLLGDAIRRVGRT